ADALASWTLPDFDDSAFSGGGSQPTILITETGSGSPDYVEIQNVSDQVVDTKDWVVAMNIGTTSDINAVHTSYWHLDDSMAPGEVLYRRDDAQEPSTGFNISWSGGGTGWAMIVDGGGSVVDFVAWRYDAKDIESLNTTVNSFPVSASSAWKGPGSPIVNSGLSTLRRAGSLDHDDESDFFFATPDPDDWGVQNGELTLPFASGRMPGIGFDTFSPGFGGTLQTDVLGEMHEKNASLWLRIPFEAGDPSAIDVLRLRLKYNDGFIAYLNGHKIAESNAPAAPTWNSSATAARSIEESITPQEFILLDALQYLVPGTNLLAIHAMNVDASDGNFLIIPELFGIATDWTLQHFITPTPGEYNGESFVSFADDVEFSEKSGFHEDPFQLEITCDTPETTIRYTTDGSEPTDTLGTIYDGPLTIDSTTVIRAVAYNYDYRPLNAIARTYIFLDDVLTQDGEGMPTNWGPVGTNYDMDLDVVNDPRYRDTLKDDLR
ncbi:hypothetical protein LCGC14_2521660, partial [marine sediment metagenome]